MTSFVTTSQTTRCLKQKIVTFSPPVETSRFIPQDAAGLTELCYVAVLPANVIVIRVNLIIENVCVLYRTTHKANKVNPAGAMQSGGFM